MYIHPKDVGSEFLVDVMIEKNIIGIDSEKAKERVPETIVFLIIILPGYPDVPPKVLTKSNFCSPSLMDGRDLLKDICPNWTPKSNLKPKKKTKSSELKRKDLESGKLINNFN